MTQTLTVTVAFSKRHYVNNVKVFSKIFWGRKKVEGGGEGDGGEGGSCVYRSQCKPNRFPTVTIFIDFVRTKSSILSAFCVSVCVCVWGGGGGGGFYQLGKYKLSGAKTRFEKVCFYEWNIHVFITVCWTLQLSALFYWFICIFLPLLCWIVCLSLEFEWLKRHIFILWIYYE